MDTSTIAFIAGSIIALGLILIYEVRGCKNELAKLNKVNKDKDSKKDRDKHNCDEEVDVVDPDFIS